MAITQICQLIYLRMTEVTTMTKMAWSKSGPVPLSMYDLSWASVQHPMMWVLYQTTGWGPTWQGWDTNPGTQLPCSYHSAVWLSRRTEQVTQRLIIGTFYFSYLMKDKIWNLNFIKEYIPMLTNKGGVLIKIESRMVTIWHKFWKIT